MEASKTAILKLFGLLRTNDYLPIEDILEKYPTAPEYLKELLEEGLIQTYNGEKIDPQKDFMDQLKPGLRITDAGYSLLFRSQFLF